VVGDACGCSVKRILERAAAGLRAQRLHADMASGGDDGSRWGRKRQRAEPKQRADKPARRARA